MTVDAAQIRPLVTGDSIATLTALLQRAHAPLAAADMNFTAASQIRGDGA